MRATVTAVLAAAALLLGGCAAESGEPGATGTVEPTAAGSVEPTAARTVEPTAAGSGETTATETSPEVRPMRIAALTYETAAVVAELGAIDRLVMVPQSTTNPVLSNHAEEMAEVEVHAPIESAIDAEAVIAANPDLVLLNDRHGLEAGVGSILRGAGIPVLVLPNTWASVADMLLNIDLVGEAIGSEAAASTLVEEIETGLVDESDSGGPRVLVLSNQAGRPFVTAGGAFPLEVLRLAGGVDASESLGMVRSGPISAEQVLAANPDRILLVDMNGSGDQIFRALLDNPAVAGLPAVAEHETLLLEGRFVHALGLADTIVGRDRIAEWLAGP